MSKPIAVIDTNIIITLLDNTKTPTVTELQNKVQLTIERLSGHGARWIIPTPVIAELSGQGLATVKRALGSLLNLMRIQVLDIEAAEAAGTMSIAALKDRKGRERGAVKFDALIAGTAHSLGATWLLTSNPKDMQHNLNALRSSVQLVDPKDPPPGQQVMTQIVTSKPKG